MNRGARRAPTFVGDESCSLFLTVLSQLPERFGVIVHAYALMPNHFHLMLETPRGNLSEAMRYLGGEYTQRLNRLHSWDGPVFRGRFRSKLVQDDAYWEHLLAYVHLNPVRAFLVGEPEESLWTSHAAYIGAAPQPEWLTCEPLLRAYGSVEALRAYVHALQVGREQAPKGFDAAALWSREPELAPVKETSELVTVEQALAQVAEVTGSGLAALKAPKMGRGGHKARWIAVWWLTHAAGLSQAEAGAQLGLSRVHASKLLAQLRETADADARGWRRALLERRDPGA